MHSINKSYRIEEKDRRITLEIIKSMGFKLALEEAYSKALYLIANTPTATYATEWLAWSHNLLEDSREVKSLDVARDLRLLASFYRRLAHKVYWYQRQTGQLSERKDFLRLVTDDGSNFNIQ